MLATPHRHSPHRRHSSCSNPPSRNCAHTHTRPIHWVATATALAAVVAALLRPAARPRDRRPAARPATPGRAGRGAPPTPAGVDFPLDCGPARPVVKKRPPATSTATAAPRPSPSVHCDAAIGHPARRRLRAHRRPPAPSSPRVVATLVDPKDRTHRHGLRRARRSRHRHPARLLVARRAPLLPRRAADRAKWQWKNGAFVRSTPSGAQSVSDPAHTARAVRNQTGVTSDAAVGRSLRVGPVDLDAVRNPPYVDAVARALLRGVHDIREQRQRHRRCRALGLQQLVVARSSRRPDRRCPARTPRARTGRRSRHRCTDPGRSRPPAPRRRLRPPAARSSLLPFPRRASDAGIGPALTGVEHFDPTSGRFPIMFGGYSPGVRESARVKIGHTPTVFVI